MSARAESPRLPSPNWLHELAATPGRAALAARVTAGVVLVVVLTMTFRIPEAAYAAYLVFLVSQREFTATVRNGLGSALIATLALMLTLLLYAIDAGEPALRVPLIAVVTYAGIYASRRYRFGPAAFVGAFLMVLTQTLIDAVPTLEGLVRAILWLWLVAALPVAAAVLIHGLTGSSAQCEREALRQRLLNQIAEAVTADSEPDPALIGEAAELLQRCPTTTGAAADRRAAARAEAIAECLLLAPALNGAPATLRAALASALRRLNDAPTVMPALPDPELIATLDAETAAVFAAYVAALHRFVDGAGEPAATSASAALAERQEAARHALKTALAVTIVYVLYNALDWQGLRTSVVTCFFVALATIGETLHKLTLRFGGAVLGGGLAALCIVYLLPRMTDIGELALLIGAVTMGCAWIAAGGERLAYGGMQLAFAFYLGVLQGYGPTSELTVLRDRVAGIVLGNMVMTLVFTSLWPVRVADRARNAISAMASAMAARLETTTRSIRPMVATMMAAQRLIDFAAFERRSGSVAAVQSFTRLQRLLPAVLVAAPDADAARRLRAYGASLTAADQREVLMLPPQASVPLAASQRPLWRQLQTWSADV